MGIGAPYKSYFKAFVKSSFGKGSNISSSTTSSFTGGAPFTSFAGAFGGGALAAFPSLPGGA
jgi:hypothetical protein